MQELSTILAESKSRSRRPLEGFPWSDCIEELLEWLSSKPKSYQPFVFDMVMSLAYVDASADLLKKIQYCENLPEPFNAIVGFTNLCGGCFQSGKWQFQSAAKPQSGSIGKISSEVLLAFVEKLFFDCNSVYSVGGVSSSDFLIETSDGQYILGEIKAAPLLTYPIMFSTPEPLGSHHESVVCTSSQLSSSPASLLLHEGHHLQLGRPESHSWPFDAFLHQLQSQENCLLLEKAHDVWWQAKSSYTSKTGRYYWLANACGKPPKEAWEHHGWPRKESISDSKTSAGADRTDDIKKAIYQLLKIALDSKSENVKVAFISNLPPLRHNKEYLEPFQDIRWTTLSEIIRRGHSTTIPLDHLKKPFDYFITLLPNPNDPA